MLKKGIRQVQWKIVLSCIAVFLISSLSFLHAQSVEDYSIVLKTSTFLPEACVEWSSERRASLECNRYQDKYYLILQFHALPSRQQHAELEARGIQLLEYIPNNAYLASIPTSISTEQLIALNVRTAIPFEAAQKIAPELTNTSVGTIELILHLHKSIQVTEIRGQLPPSIQITNTDPLQVRIAQAEIPNLVALPFVKYISPIPPPPSLLDTRSKSVRGKYLNTPEIGGLEGEGVMVGIGDGGVGSHIDLTGRYISHITGSGVNTQDHPHANMVAGLLGNSGILRSQVDGIAPKSTLIYEYSSQILSDNIVNSNVADGMVLTNNSYGSGEGGSYTLYSRRCDDQLKRHPQLMHVFSAGNSGNKTQVGFPKGYNTVLMNGQSAKNAISVGGINHYNELYSGSSRGPTQDGRLKPEITAIAYSFLAPTSNNNYQNGYGTSFSAPQVTGGLALLYEHYRNLHNGNDPDAALMKAILCNTAEDIGNPGPDYTHGYGKMNLRRAKELLDNQHYFSGTLEDGESTTFSINVPPNTHEMKIMLYWADTSASVIVGKDLVNDLDLRVIRQSNSNVYLPYILDPNEADSDAFPNVDRFNNIEQVVVNNPPTDTYSISINAHKVPFGVQNFHIVYEFVQPGVTLISPVPEELIRGGGSTNFYIEWDYYGNDNNTFSIEYSPDEGSNWVVLCDSVDSESRIYRWQKSMLTDLNTSQALIKISRNNTAHLDVVAAPFKIYNYIYRLDFKMTPLCDDDILFTWPPSNGASAYELLQYDGDREMGVIASTSDTSLLLQYPYTDGDAWFAVQVVYPNGTRSVRSDAKLFVPPSGNSNNSCPPSQPLGIRHITGQYHIQFFWEAATDDGGVTGYNIYENGVFLETVNELSKMIHYTQPGLSVEYCVSAIDANGNESPSSCFYTATAVENTCNQDVIFITKYEEPSDDELLIVNQLQGSVYHIFTIGSEQVSDYLWDKNWTAMISPEAIIDTDDLPFFDDVPLIVMNEAMLMDFNLATSTTGVISKDLDLISPYHPVSAGITGAFPFYTNQYFMKGAGELPPAAIPLAKFEDICNVLFIYEAGAEMANGVIAQEKRVAFPIQYYQIEHLSTEARKLIESSLAWVAGCAVEQPLVPVDLIINPDFTSIQLSWDFLNPTGNNIDNYAVYLDDILIATTNNTFYTINGLTPSTNYKISVSSLTVDDVESDRIYQLTETLTCKELELYVFLEGALDPLLPPGSTNIQMSTMLNQRDLLPGQEEVASNLALSAAGHPYYEAPWNYGDYENIGIYDEEVVDWVLVSFRTGIESNSEVYRLTGLLYKNGLVHFPRTCIDYTFADPVYIIIEHRNHLGIMSTVPVTLDYDRLIYDFRTQDSYTQTSSGQKEMIPGVFAMYTGDGNQVVDIESFQINGADKVRWVILNGSFNLYEPEDFNLDGDVNGADKALWNVNNGLYSSVPK